MEPTRPAPAQPPHDDQWASLDHGPSKERNVADYLKDTQPPEGKTLVGRVTYGSQQMSGDQLVLPPAIVERLNGPTGGTQGVTLSNLDAGSLHRGELHLRQRTVDEQRTLQVEFDLMPAAHHTIVNYIADASDFSTHISQRFGGDELPEVAILGQRAHEFFIADAQGAKFSAQRVEKIGRAFEIEIGPDIRVLVGNPEDQFQAFRRRVWVQVRTEDIQAGWETVQKTLAALGLESCCQPAREDQIRMRRVMLALHQIAPKVAYELSRQNWESITFDDLRAKCDAHGPGLWDRIMRLLEPGSPHQISELANGSKLAVPELVTELRRKGAVGLMRGVDCELELLAHMSSFGASSARRRWESGFIQIGTSTQADFRTGGGANVFARLVTSNMLDSKIPVESFPFSGTFQLLYSLEAMSMSCYGYPSDKYGDKTEANYRDRPALDQLTAHLNSREARCPQSNEIMIPDYLSASYLQHIVVDSEASRSFWIEQCRWEGLVEIIAGKEYLKGAYQKPLEEFFIAAHRVLNPHTGEKFGVFTKSMWDG